MRKHRRDPLKKQLVHATRAVEKAFRKGKYRPTVTMILLHTDSKGIVSVLWGRSARSGNISFFPKGGIDPGESIIDAAYKEAKEEAGIRKSQLKIKKIAGLVKMEDWPLKAGYSKGKLHVLVVADYLGNKYDIVLEKKELFEYGWIQSVEDFQKLFLHVSPGRRLSLWCILQAAGVPWAVPLDLRTKKLNVVHLHAA